MTTKEVAEAFGTKTGRVREWVKNGAPTKRVGRNYSFAPEELLAWLVANGLAGQEGRRQKVYKLRSEVAHRFGVGIRIISEWCSDPEFPGRAGTAKERGRDGYFPEYEIAQWIVKNKRRATVPDELLVQISEESKVTSGPDDRDRLVRLRGDRVELEVGQLKSELVDVDKVRSYFVRVVNESKSLLMGARMSVLSAMPADKLSDEELAAVMASYDEQIEKVMTAWSDLLKYSDAVADDEEEELIA